MKNQFVVNTKGQSLLEITIAIGVAVLVISALTITTLIGLRNSQFSQNQILATKYAQEGLEKVKSMRLRNEIVCTNGGLTQRTWIASDPSNMWGLAIDATTPTTFYIDPSASPTCKLSDSPGLISSEDPITGTIFTRRILISDYSGSTQKKFVSKVAWTDSTGTHKSEISTILASY